MISLPRSPTNVLAGLAVGFGLVGSPYPPRPAGFTPRELGSPASGRHDRTSACGSHQASAAGADAQPWALAASTSLRASSPAGPRVRTWTILRRGGYRRIVSVPAHQCMWLITIPPYGGGAVRMPAVTAWAGHGSRFNGVVSTGAGMPGGAPGRRLRQDARRGPWNPRRARSALGEGAVGAHPLRSTPVRHWRRPCGNRPGSGPFGPARVGLVGRACMS